MPCISALTEWSRNKDLKNIGYFLLVFFVNSHREEDDSCVYVEATKNLFKNKNKNK